LAGAAVFPPHPLPRPTAQSISIATRALRNLTDMDIVDLTMIAQAAGFGDYELDTPLQPRGYRLLDGIATIPNTIAERLVERFGTLQALMAASLEDLRDVDGIGEHRARTVRESLSRMAESSLEKYL